MGASAADTEFSALQFEKTLTNLKDSQESINQCCQWCLSNRQHYKKIVSSWLNVIKRVKIEQRLTLFYLANDVVQYSKRRNYEYVDTWGTAIQKATTMVRDEKVKHKILRIFKIWEHRAVYGEEFIADLCGLISVQPTGPKSDEPHEFQASYVINKIKTCANLEKDTDTKLKMLKEHNPKIQISEGLINSLKDRAHVDDVEKEVDVYVDHMEDYINALKVEIKNRIALISVLKQAETQLESDRKDVKMVAHAYKTFSQRVKLFQKKLEEHMEALPSPVPSPDINAPSPSPEEDLELPEDNATDIINLNSTENSLDISAIHYTNPGYYVPPPTSNTLANTTSYNNSYNSASFNSTMNNTNPDASASFLSNGFTSFLGQNVSFDISNISTTGLFSNSLTENSTVDITRTTNSYVTTPTAVAQPVVGPVVPPIVDLTGNDVESPAPYNPLLPPPMPPFSKNNESGFSFNSSMDISTTSTYDPAYLPPSYTEAAYSTDTPTLSDTAHYDYQLQTGTNPYPPSVDDSYDPSQVTEAWDDIDNPLWNELKDATDTPESPPMFEKEGYGDPVEYHDSSLQSGAVDVDHRVIPGMGDLEDSLSSLGGKDVDHRNLISLTGSPNVEAPINGGHQPKPLPARSNLKTITPQESLWDTLDQDYRSLPPPVSDHPPVLTIGGRDQDYRLQFNLEVPPPPPPPPKSPVKRRPPPPPPLPAPGAPGDPRLRFAGQSPKKGDIVAGDDDMDLSDDLDASADMLTDADVHLSLEPPPPLPDLLDDVDANQFLDEITNDLNEFSNLSSELNVPEDEPTDGSDNSNLPDIQNTADSNQSPIWGPLQPPPMGFGMGAPPGMMGSPPSMGFPPPPPADFMPDMNRMDPPPRPGLLPPPIMDGPPMGPPFPPSPNWNERQPPPWVPPNNLALNDDNPYLNDDNDHEFPSGFRHNRGGMINNFRGGFDNGFNKGGMFPPGGFRGRGRGRGGPGSPWKDRGGMRGRGGNRGARGMGAPFRPRGFFRGRGR